MQTGVIKKRRTRPLSEYGTQLKEKQELKHQYNLREAKFKAYVAEILSKGGAGSSAELLMQKLEKRLDNVVFRMGFGETRKQAKQLVSHGHFFVNGRAVDISSSMTKKGDKISVRPSSQNRTLFQSIKLGLKKYQPPSWIQLDKENMAAEIIGEPTLVEVAPTVEIPLIFEFYSR